MSKIIKKAFGDTSHYKLFRYPYDDTQIHEGDTINNEKIVIKWIGNDQEELYFYDNCLTKIKEIEPKLCVYQIDKNKDLVIGWKKKDEATPRVEFDKHDTRERVVTEAGVEVTSDTVLHVGDKLHFENTLFSNIQRFETEAYDSDSITWTRSKTITDYGEIQLNYQKVDLRNVDHDPKTPFNMASNPKANLVITNPYDGNKVVHAGDNVLYKHNFFHATMNENYAFNPDGSHYIELVDASTNLYRITDRAPFFNIKYAGKVKIIIQDPSDWTAEYFTAEGSHITNNQMMQVGSIIKIRLATDTVDVKNVPNHTTLVGHTYWNSDDDPYDLRKEYSVKIDVDESLTTVTLKPPQPQPSTVFKTNADIYNDKVIVESHLNHINADPLPSDPSWFHQNEVVKISFKGDYGLTGYKIESVQNAVHVGEDYYYATSPECIINVTEVTDYKLHILKSAPGVTEEECGVYDTEVQNKKYPDGAILSLNKIIRVIPQEDFIIDQDRFVDLELVDANTLAYKVTGLNPTVATKVAPFVTITNENPDQIVIRTTRYPQITLSTYPDNTHVRLDNQITMDIDSPTRRSFKIIHSGLEYLNFSDYYKVIGMNVNVKIAPKKPPLQIKLSGPNIENAVYNDSISRGVENNDPVYEGERIIFKYPNGYTTLTEIVGFDVISEAPGYRNMYTVREDATEVKLTWTETPKAHLNNTTPQIIVVSTVETEDPEAITDFPENVLHIGERFKVAYFYSVEHPENYEIEATNAKFLEVDEDDGARIYKITGANPTVKAKLKPKNVTVYIPNPDNTKYTVLQEDDTPITDGTIVKSGQSFKIKMINRFYEYKSDSIIDCELSSTSHYGDNIPIYTFTIKEDIVADSIVIPPPTGSANVVLNVLPDGNSDKVVVTAIDDGNRLITAFPDNSLHNGELFKPAIKPEFNDWRIKDVYNGQKVNDEIWKVNGDPCNIIVEKQFHITVYTAGGNDPNEIIFYKTNQGLDENIINDISLVKFSENDQIHFKLCKWVEVDTDNSNLITYVGEENGVLTYSVNGEGCVLHTKLKNNAYMLSIENAADGVGHVYRADETTIIENHFYVEKDEIIVAKAEDPKIVPDVVELELVSHENNTYKFKVLSGGSPNISFNDHTPVLIDSNHPDWIIVKKDDSTGPVLTLPDNTTFRKYMNVQMSIELKDEFDPRCYEITATGVIEYGPGQYREAEHPIEEDVHITVTLTKGVLHILKSSLSSTEEEFDLVDPDNALQVYNPDDAYPIGTKMKFVPKDPKYKVDLDRCKDVTYDSGVFTITGPDPTIASKAEVNVTVNIPTPNDVVYEVLKDDGSVLPDGTVLKAGNTFKIKLKKKFFKYEANSITDCTLTNTEEQTDTHLPIYTFKINPDITATSITIPYPTETDKVKLDVEHTDQIHVLAVEDGNRVISVFPDQSIHVGEKVKAIFKTTELQELWEIKSITNATQDGEHWVLTGPECKVMTEKKKAHITVNATCGIDDGEITLYKSTTPGDPPIDPDTNPEFELGTKIYVKFHKYVKLDDDQSSGIELVGPEGDFVAYKLVHPSAVFTTTLKDDVFEIQITISTPGSAEVFRENETDTLESSDYIAKDEIVVVKVIDSKFVPTINCLTQISHVGNKYTYKVTGDGNPTILIEDRTPITIDSNHPELLKVMDEYGAIELTLPDSSSYNFSSLSHSIRVYLKDGLDPSFYSFTVTGATDTGFNNIYKFNDPLPTTVMINVTVAKGTLIIVTNESADEVKVTNVAGDTEYHTSDQLEIGTQIKILPKLGFTVDLAKIADIEVVDAGQSIYKITGLNPKVECKRDKVIILIPDEDHVDVFTVPGNEQIHNSDFSQQINNQLKVIPKYPYKLKNDTIVGMEVVDADNGIYKITGYNVNIELEELEFASIDVLPSGIFKVKTVRPPIQEITTFPNNNTLRVTDQFTLEFKNSDDELKCNVEITGADLVSGNTYQVRSNVVSIIAVEKQVTVHILNSTHVTVTKHPSSTPVVDGDTTVKILDILKIIPEEGYKLSTTTGLEADPLNENCYKVKATNVVIDVELHPFVTINNQTTDVLAVCTADNISTAISIFPNSDTIRKTASFYILYKGSNNATTHNIVVTGATLVSGNKYIADEDTVEVKAVPKFTPSKINISGEIAGVTVKAVDDGRELHNGDTSVHVDDKITVVLKPTYKFEVAMTGVEATGADNEYKIVDTEVNIKIDRTSFVTIENETPTKTIVKTVDPEEELTVFPCSDKVRKGANISVDFRSPYTSTDYNLDVEGAVLHSPGIFTVKEDTVHISAYKRNITIRIVGGISYVSLFDSSDSPLPNGSTAHPNSYFKIQKTNTNVQYTVTGANVDAGHVGTDELSAYYLVDKFADEVVINVRGQRITIDNLSKEMLAIKTVDPVEEITTFPCSDKLYIDDEFTVDFKVADKANYYDVIATNATLVSGNKYKVTADNVTVKSKHKLIVLTTNNVGHSCYNIYGSPITTAYVFTVGEVFKVSKNNRFVTITVTGAERIPDHPAATDLIEVYRVIDDTTSVVVTGTEVPYITIDNESTALLTIKTINPDMEINTFPCNDKLHEGQLFSVTFKDPADAAQYTISVVGANHTTGEQYTPTANSITVKAVRKVVIHIPDETHVQVTKVPENTPIHNNDNTLSIDSQIKIVAIPKWEYKLKPVVGATVVDADNGIYKITAVDVTIEAELVPFITINNNNQDIVAVYTKPGNGGRITVFPCTDKVHQNQDIYVKYVNEATQKPVYDISVVGAIANTEEYSYKAGVTDITVSASRKILSATIHIGHAEHVTVKAVDDGRELHDGDISVSTTQFITITPKSYWHMKPTLLHGLEATSEENKFMVIDREVFIDVEEDQAVTINNLKKALLKVEVGTITLNTFPDYTHLHMDEEFTISFFNASLDPKYDLNVTGATFISTVGNRHKYKATSSNVIVDAELKPVPATIHITGDANIDVTTVPGGVAIHDGDTSQFVGNKLKIVPKHGYKLKLPLTGIVVEDVSNNIYKIMDENVTIEAVLIPFVTINNESTDLLKVVTTYTPSEELTVFPCSDKVHEDENFIISFKLASNVTKYDVVVTGATRVAGNIYKATTANITVKAEAKFPPATIHIIDGDHVDVADATSGRVILDNDTLMFVGDTITVVPKSGYKLKQKVGLELLSKPSKLYKIANASVTIEVEEIPTPPAPPPGSMTHNTILWYLKSLFYGGV